MDSTTKKYELRYKTEGAKWRVFDTYKSLDSEDFIKFHKTYSNARIITDVEVVEITTTRKVIEV